MIDFGILSVDSGRIGHVLKEKIGQITADVEPLCQGCGSEEPPGQIAQRGVAGGDELERLHRRGQPAAPQPEEGVDGIVEKHRQQILRGGRPVGQIPGLPQPVETFRFHTDLFIDADGGRSLPEPLIGSFQQFGAEAFVVEEDAGFAEERGEAR